MAGQVIIECLHNDLWVIRDQNTMIHPEARPLVLDLLRELNKRKRNCLESCSRSMLSGCCGGGTAGFCGCCLCGETGWIVWLIVLALLLLFSVFILIAMLIEYCYQARAAKIVKNYAVQLQPYYQVTDDISSGGCCRTKPFVIILTPKISPQNMVIQTGQPIQMDYQGPLVPTYNSPLGGYNQVPMNTVITGNTQLYTDFEKPMPVAVLPTREDVPLAAVNTYRVPQDTIYQPPPGNAYPQQNIPIMNYQMENTETNTFK